MRWSQIECSRQKIWCFHNNQTLYYMAIYCMLRSLWAHKTVFPLQKRHKIAMLSYTMSYDIVLRETFPPCTACIKFIVHVCYQVIWELRHYHIGVVLHVIWWTWCFVLSQLVLFLCFRIIVIYHDERDKCWYKDQSCEIVLLCKSDFNSKVGNIWSKIIKKWIYVFAEQKRYYNGGSHWDVWGNVLFCCKAI